MNELPPAFVAALVAVGEMAMAAGGQRVLVIAPRRLEEAEAIIEAVRRNQPVLSELPQNPCHHLGCKELGTNWGMD